MKNYLVNLKLKKQYPTQKRQQEKQLHLKSESIDTLMQAIVKHYTNLESCSIVSDTQELFLKK